MRRRYVITAGAGVGVGLVTGCLGNPDTQPAETATPTTTETPATETPTTETTEKPESGYLGTYYNLSESHPDMQEGASGRGKGLVKDTLPLRLTSKGEEDIDQFDWYSSEYEAFSRVDEDIQWESEFFPITDGDKEGDPFHFSVHWTANVAVPETDEYSFRIESDDDSWVFIDEELTLDNGGIHPANDVEKSVELSGGDHSLDIFYAERYTSNASVLFEPDERVDI